MNHIIIVGCGVIGATCAYYLTKAGQRVTMLDQGRFAGGASHANCGYICPSHVLPLATPGAVGKTMKAMLQPDSPFSVRPGMNFALWGWLLKFARRCNQRDMVQATGAIHALLQSSRPLYDEIIATEKFEVEWETKGLVFVFQTKPALEHYDHTAKMLSDQFGLHADRYDGDALVELEPTLKPGLAGGWRYRGDAHLRPDKLMACWRTWLADHGVAIHEQCKFESFILDQGKVVGVKSNKGDFTGSHVIMATGAWTPMLNDQLQCKVPIQPGKGYSMTMQRPNPCPTIPLIFEEHRVAVTPFQSGYRLGSIMEFAGYDASMNRNRLELLRKAASHYLHVPYAEPVVEEWWGWRPMTYDSIPIIGPVPAYSNVYLATGHSMLGLSMAPGTGKLLTEMILGEKPHVDPEAYRVTRF